MYISVFGKKELYKFKGTVIFILSKPMFFTVASVVFAKRPWIPERFDITYPLPSNIPEKLTLCRAFLS